MRDLETPPFMAGDTAYGAPAPGGFANAAAVPNTYPAAAAYTAPALGWEFQPGQPEYVYHFHHGSDELLIVLRGHPKLRTQDGERTLEEGEVVALPRGPEGGRAISNPSDAVVRILMVSSNADPDVSEYPETGKIGVITDGRTWQFFRREDAAEHAL